MSASLIVAGSLKAAMGIGQAVFGDAQRDKAAARARGQAMKQYRAKKKQLYAQYYRDLEQFNANVQYTEQLWNAKFQQGMADIAFTNQHAADTYYLRQQQLNQQFQQLAFEDQDRSIRFAKSQGVAAAKAQQGVTAGRFDVANAAIKGRNEAIQAREVTGMIDSFDMQSAIDNRVAAHKLNNIGRRMAILPQLGRVPDVPTMPERPTGFAQNNSALWMDITGSLVDGAVTALGAGAGRNPGNLGNQVPRPENVPTETAQVTNNFQNINYDPNQQFGTDPTLNAQFGTGGFKFR